MVLGVSNDGVADDDVVDDGVADRGAEGVTANDEIIAWTIAAARGAEDKLAMNTLVVDVGEVLGITDYFLITAGANSRQVRAISNGIEEAVVRSGGPGVVRREGHDTFEWMLLDFGSFICHVFIEEHRAYYELERLWGDRPRIEWAEEGTQPVESNPLSEQGADEASEEE